MSGAGRAMALADSSSDESEHSDAFNPYEPSLSSKLSAEFLGTFLLVFTIGCNVLMDVKVWAGASIGGVLMVAIYALGGVSGGNFNPSVTTSLVLAKLLGHQRGLDVKTGIMYIVVQVAGGICGAVGYYVTFSKSFNLSPKGDFTYVEDGCAEVTYTVMLCLVVMCVAIAGDNAPNEFFGLAIGNVIVAGANGAGAISGGCFNPAVSIGVDVVSQSRSVSWGAFYVVCQIVAACIATGLFSLVYPKDFNRRKTLMTDVVSEFLGTFFLVTTVGLNVLASSPAAAAAIACSLMSMIYALGSVSGAHFNPAVTLAAALSGAVSVSTAIAYVVAQFLGGTAAGLSYTFMRKGGTFSLGPTAPYGYFEAGVGETIFTFVLAFVVLCVAVAKITKSKTMFGLAIGSCVTVGGNAIGGISGGSLNPAVSFGITVSSLAAGGSFVPFLYYAMFEFGGGLLAAVVFRVTHAMHFDTPDFESNSNCE